MHIAINTGSLSDNTPDALARAAALGFSHVELTLHSAEFDYGYRRRPNVRFYRQLKQQLDELGLTAWSVTAPALTQTQMFSPRARKEILLNAAGAGGVVGAQVLVVQPAHLFRDENTVEAYLRDNLAPPIVDGVDEAWAQVVNRRMTMALPNTSHWLGTPLTNQPERIATITYDLAIGWALDVRRAVHHGPLETWLEKAGERLVIAHLYDLDTDNRTDIMPQAEEWASWLPILAQSRLHGVVLRSDPGQSDATIRASHDHIAQFLQTNN